MDKALSFFRVFDWSFFLPGFIVAHFTQLAPTLRSLRQANTGSPEIEIGMTVVTIIISSYVVGLCVHALARIPQWIVKKIRKTKEVWLLPRMPGWLNPKDESTLKELRGYFWYTRAACVNTSVALLLVLGSNWGEPPVSEHTVLFLVAIVLLGYLYIEFDRALRGLNAPGA